MLISLDNPNSLIVRLEEGIREAILMGSSRVQLRWAGGLIQTVQTSLDQNSALRSYFINLQVLRALSRAYGSAITQVSRKTEIPNFTAGTEVARQVNRTISMAGSYEPARYAADVLEGLSSLYDISLALLNDAGVRAAAPNLKELDKLSEVCDIARDLMHIGIEAVPEEIIFEPEEVAETPSPLLGRLWVDRLAYAIAGLAWGSGIMLYLVQSHLINLQ